MGKGKPRTGGEPRLRYLPEIPDEDWDSLNKLRKEHSLSWKQVFERLRVYRGGVEYIFTAPGKMTKQTRLDLNTVMGLINIWISNIGHNWYEIHNSPDIAVLKETGTYAGRPAICVGAGPSLFDHEHLDRLAESSFQDKGGVVLSTAHALKWCLGVGVVPDIVNVVDSDQKMVDFIAGASVDDEPAVDEMADEIKLVYIASTHPEVLARWRGKQKYTFMSGVPQDLIPNVDTFLSVLLPELTQLDSGGNSGTFNFSLAAYLGCSPVGLIGMDLSYPKDYPYERTQYYNAYLQSVGLEYRDVRDMIEKCYTDYTHPIYKTECYYDFVYEVFRNGIHELSKIYEQTWGTKLVNCTEGGAIYGDNIECIGLEEFIERYTV